MNRIKILDSFRCIAILMVLFYHYTATFTKEHSPSFYPNHPAASLYPFGDGYAEYFKNGYLGVELFFIISGFVIYMTLDRSSSFVNFIVKRFFRLFPLLLVCALITFSIPVILDHDKALPLFHKPAHDFFPSLTFLDLWIWNAILKIKDIQYVDNVYWTLGVEMRFYIFMGLLYFIAKKNFFPIWLCLCLIMIVAYAAVSAIVPQHTSAVFINIKKLLETTLIASYLVYFSLGVYFYRLYNSIPTKVYEVVLILLSVAAAASSMPLAEIIALVIFSILFLLFIYRPQYLSLLSNKMMLFIGLISYPLYLVHDNIGIFLMRLFANDVDVTYKVVVLIPVILSVVFLAWLLHIYVEKPIGALVKKYVYPAKKSE